MSDILMFELAQIYRFLSMLVFASFETGLFFCLKFFQ